MPKQMPRKTTPNQGCFFNLWPSWRRSTVFAILLTMLMSLSMLYVIARTVQSFAETAMLGDPEPSEHSIMVEGEASVTVEPDTAQLTIGVETSGDTVAEAQDENTAITNELIASIKALGVADADLQTTNYNVYEDERWNPEIFFYETYGWIVSQQLEITIRDLDNVSKVMDAAGQGGATSVYGLDFTTEDLASAKQRAREEAVADALAQAADIADALDVKLGEVIDYSEWFSGEDDYRYYDYAEGLGGGGEIDIEPGSESMTLSVTVWYLLRD